MTQKLPPEVILRIEKEAQEKYTQWQNMYGALREGYKTGAKEYASRALPLVEALKSAIALIKHYHDCDRVWDYYYNRSPEMKPIREALNQYKEG
jgi:hypothetical protein